MYLSSSWKEMKVTYMLIKISSIFKFSGLSSDRKPVLSFLQPHFTFFARRLLVGILTGMMITPQLSLAQSTNNMCKDPITFRNELLEQEIREVLPDGSEDQKASFFGKTYKGSPAAAEALEKIVSPIESYSTSEEKVSAAEKSLTFFTANAKNCTDIHCLYLDLFQNEEAAQHALILGIKYKIYLGMHPDNSVDGLRPQWSLHGLQLILKSIRALPAFIYKYNSLKKIVQVSPLQSEAFRDYNNHAQIIYAQQTKTEFHPGVKNIAGLCTTFDKAGNSRHLIHIVINDSSPENEAQDTRNIYHEFGHALEKEMTYKNYLEGKQALENYSAEIQSTDNCKNSFVTPYAKKNSEEDFAETFQHSLLPAVPATDGQCKIQAMQRHILKGTKISHKTNPLFQWINNNIGCRAIAQFCARKTKVFLPKDDPHPHFQLIGENFGYSLNSIVNKANCLEKVLNDHIFPNIPQCGTPSPLVSKMIESDLRKSCQSELQTAFEDMAQKFLNSKDKPAQTSSAPSVQTPLF